MRSVRLVLLASLAAAALPAAARDRGLGLAVQNNIAAMTVDLTPNHAGARIEGGAGTNADGAVNRYRNGRVKPLLPLSGRSDLGNVALGPAGLGGNAPGTTQQGGPR
jgi:hypothetical protein